MSEISKAYEPQSVEDKWYDFWVKQGCFAANENSSKPAYSIVIPPPNVTGVLTMGHVLNNTIQDILARKARMEGKEVLWLPGTDHAGIATQNAVEKSLKKAGEIKHRDDLGREAMVAKIWEWKAKYGGIIIQQLKKLGASCDWSRERFTMDPEYSRCVQKVFVDLYKKGHIYRGKRMVNWCPASLTALSDEEVVMKEQRGFMYHFRVLAVEANGTPVKGVQGIPLTPALSPKGGEGEEPKASNTPRAHSPSLAPTGGEGQGEGASPQQKGGPELDPEGRVWLTIATTRPETIPGDTAVAVNPKDPRYAQLIGKFIVRPLPLELPVEQKLIPIIGDEHVDFQFGTGVLKVTPAHDKADFEIGARHKLAAVEVIDATGHMNDTAGADLRGLDRFKARKVAVEKLTEHGVMVKEEPYTNNVGYSERADVPIEPRLSEQWFLKYPSVEKSRDVVAKGVMKFHPDRWAKVYDHWMGGLQDWCISRQLWWGHRIPVWSKMISARKFRELGLDEDTTVCLTNDFNEWPTDRRDTTTLSLSGETPEQILSNKTLFKVAWNGDSRENIIVSALTDNPEEAAVLNKAGFTQDPDVLDTWFSSWLWPFATMGWPEQTATLKKFYPTTDLVTGPDIIFFWVARMIMAGYEYMGEEGFGLPDALPFHNVYFTGIIRDKQGRKMSKSLGNSPDPLDLIAKYGADALRFGVMRAAPLGQDILFDEQNVELGRNFCNKLWNACRFRQMVGSAEFPVQGEIEPSLLTSDDKWILLKLNQAMKELDTAFTEYRFSDATATLYRFFWSEYCDWYVEATKAVFQSDDTPRKANTLAVVDFILSHVLRMFHPFLPFITEELWHGMGYQTDMPADQGGTTIMFAPWAKPFDEFFLGHYGLDDCYLGITDQKYEVVTLGRNLKREGNIQSGKKVKFVFKPVNFTPPHDIAVLKILLNAESLEVDENYAPKKGTLSAKSDLGILYLPMEGLVDIEAERARLTKELAKINAEITKVEQKLANPAFTQKVPAEVLQEHQKRLVEWNEKRIHTQSALDALEG